MSEISVGSSQPENAQWAGERTITEYWASVGASNSMNTQASNIPFGLGILIYFPMYVLKALFVGSGTRYTLTNRRLRVDKGVAKKTAQSIPLDEITDVKVDDYIPFTRTGNLLLMGKSGELGRMVGIQDPTPARQTILDAVHSRIEVAKVMLEQRSTVSAPA